MSFLNPPDILPQIAFSVYKYLLRNQGREPEEEVILTMFSPSTLRTRTQQSDEDGRKEIRASLKHTIKACLDIELFQRQQGTLCLNPNLPESALNPNKGETLFRRTLRCLILSERLNENLFGSGEGPRDLVRALAWYLSQDLYSVPSRWESTSSPHIAKSIQQLQTSQIGGKEKWIISNDTRWQSFMRWATYLGFAWHHTIGSGEAVVPDPTIAVADVLAQLQQPKSVRWTLPDLMRRLSTELPVLDGGLFRREVEGHCKSVVPHDETSPICSWTMSHTLYSLEESGAIKMESLHDAAKIGLRNEEDKVAYFSHANLSVAIEGDIGK